MIKCNFQANSAQVATKTGFSIFNFQKERGFTLLELLLYVAISSIIILATSALVQVVLEARIKAQTVTEVEQQGQQVMQVMGQTLRNATGVTSPTIGTSAASLTATVPTGALSPTVFDLSAGAIRMKEGGGAATPLTNSRVTASALSFKNLAASGKPSSIKVTFTITYINNSGSKNEYSYTKNFETAASLRCLAAC